MVNDVKVETHFQGLLIFLSCTTPGQMLKSSSTHNGVDPLMLIINQNNGPLALPTNQSNGVFSQLKFPFPNDPCFVLTKN